jgi:hypothetical protein
MQAQAVQDTKQALTSAARTDAMLYVLYTRRSRAAHGWACMAHARSEGVRARLISSHMTWIGRHLYHRRPFIVHQPLSMEASGPQKCVGPSSDYKLSPSRFPYFISIYVVKFVGKKLCHLLNNYLL